MTAYTLHYVHDPLCGWCYAASPLLRAAEQAGLRIVLHAGGMIAEPTHIAEEMRRYIVQADQRITTMTGMEFGAAYNERVLLNPKAVYWSRPPIAAILAAETLQPGTSLPMLRTLQKAHYIEGHPIAETSSLVEAAAHLGLDRAGFEQALGTVAIDAHIAQTRRHMVQWGLRGFPGFVVEREGQFTRIGHEDFYGNPEAFVAAVLRSFGS